MKTLRLIVTLDCNLSCSYCCNKLPEIKEKFIYKYLNEIDFSKYKNICISGGEPLLIEDFIYDKIFPKITNQKIYLYTNGLFLNETNVKFWDGINIGIHNEQQVNLIISKNLPLDNIRFCVEDGKNYNLPNIKNWVMNDCFNNVDNEDWIVLKMGLGYKIKNDGN